ncbi:barwin-like endoglucanase [Dichomitus squalens LYAD-421 SS1]|uniref:barwin-like endoglucanase n=1 Tax=Dichomitus squalens (strain LYAD-421) TaxID=732165 RepID=UPI00044144D9|nr:barwin-like endoglucanase [Dichomitus squalens LYAD-421 SS1]EJF65885.1 barwin-like endoglucanase [Dichomitus squalens LYAD-421 SS1]
MHFFTLAFVALTAVAGASAIVIPHRHAHVARQTPPSTYAEGYLEDYKVYHARYMALDCEAQHNTTFFDKCCHPLLATETLAKNRAPECNPANHASSTKTSAAAPTSTGSSSGDFTGGHATFFYQGGNAGACGQVHPDSAFIAALQTKRYGDLSQESSNCGRKITATNTNNGKSVTVTVADACPTCPEENDLDLSFAAFTSIATEEEGEVPIVWHFD